MDEKLEDLAEGKRGLSDDLTALRNELDRRQSKVEQDLQRTDLTTEQRTEKEVLKNELGQQRERVERALGNVEGATNDTWQNVEQDVQVTIDDVGDWFERQAEKLDKGTARDNDEDGH